MGGTREGLVHDPLVLLQGFHKLVLVMEAPGRIAKHEVDVLGLGRLDGVKEDGRGVRAGLALHDGDLEALGPGFELFARGGAEGIARAQENGVAAAFELRGEFGDGGRLAHAVDPDEPDYGGLAARMASRPVPGVRRHGGLEPTLEVRLERSADFGRAFARRKPFDARPVHRGEGFLGVWETEIGRKAGFFEGFLERSDVLGFADPKEATSLGEGRAPGVRRGDVGKGLGIRRGRGGRNFGRGRLVKARTFGVDRDDEASGDQQSDAAERGDDPLGRRKLVEEFHGPRS